MSKNELISIELDQNEMSCLFNCAREVQSGYAAKFLTEFTNTTSEFWDEIFLSLEGEDVLEKDNINSHTKSFLFSADQWLKIYNSVNAVIYELGPEELTLLTGFTLSEMANFSRKIFAVCNKRHIGERKFRS